VVHATPGAHPFPSLPVLMPFLAGAAALVAAIAWEDFSRRPLIPLRGLAHTYPVAGILTAMIARAPARRRGVPRGAAPPASRPDRRGGGADGLRVASWIAFGLPLLGAVVVVLVFVLGHGRLQEPGIESWVDGERPAIDSHPVLAAARGVPRPETRERVGEYPLDREPVG
jgi:hypothetical protein